MKNQLMFVLSLAAMAAVSAPLSAQATQGKIHNGGVYNGGVYNGSQVNSGCTWYDVNCRLGNGNGTSDGSWQAIGRDQSGNTIYQRQRVDGNGNVIVDRARQDSRGRMIIIDSQVVQNNNNGRRNNDVRRNDVVYGPNGEVCKYKQKKDGYSTDCKYANAKGKKHGHDDDADDRNTNGVYNNTQGPWQGAQSGGKHH